MPLRAGINVRILSTYNAPICTSREGKAHLFSPRKPPPCICTAQLCHLSRDPSNPTRREAFHRFSRIALKANVGRTSPIVPARHLDTVTLSTHASAKCRSIFNFLFLPESNTSNFFSYLELEAGLFYSYAYSPGRVPPRHFGQSPRHEAEKPRVG
eukprot:1184247-Prorocentrum_minimum.AAC.3